MNKLNKSLACSDAAIRVLTGVILMELRTACLEWHIKENTNVPLQVIRKSWSVRSPENKLNQIKEGTN